MKTKDYEEVLIKGIKDNFYIETGKYIKILSCHRWESSANFTFKATIGQVIKMVFDYTKWKWKDTYAPVRASEAIYRRGLIDYTAVNNGCTLASISSFTRRGDHTTIMSSMKAFENRLETEGYVRQAFREVVDFCKDNYYIYKEKDYTKEEIIEGEE